MTAVLPNSVMAGRVGAVRNGAGTNAAIRQGLDSEQIASNLHGEDYQVNYDGNLYWAYAAAQTLTTVGTVITGLIVWNSSSTKNLVLRRYSIGVSVTSASLTGISLASTTAGAQTTTPTSTAAITRAGSGILGTGAGVGLAYTGATILTSTSFWPLLHNTAAIATTGIDSIAGDLRGGFIVPPLTAIHLAALGAASAASAVTAGLSWEEVPT